MSHLQDYLISHTVHNHFTMTVRLIKLSESTNSLPMATVKIPPIRLLIVHGKPFKFFMISLPVKLLMYRKCTIIYEVYNKRIEGLCKVRLKKQRCLSIE